MVSRMQTFLAGKSGVHLETVQQIVVFLNNDIIPFIPEHGSVGASGDLVQLSHLALTLIGEGEVFYKEELMPTAKVMEICGLKPLTLRVRDGLALANGTAVMTGIGLVNLHYANKLLSWATLTSVMMNEIAGSYDDFMSEELNNVKKHQGQTIIANNMRDITSSSQLLRDRSNDLYNRDVQQESYFTHKVQPFYSLRCTPQILGPIFDTLQNVKKILIEELDAVDDNPIVSVDTEMVYHGGNFHGDYVSLEMDKLKIVVTKLTMLVERQINYLFNDNINGLLPAFVNLGKLGLNYGLQAAQFTATSTTAECQMLANPMYVHSIPNNNDNQDVVSMGTNAALITQKVIENSFQVMAIQMMALVQAVDYLEIADKLSDKTKEVYHDIRKIVPRFDQDTTKYNEIKEIIRYLKETEKE